MTKSELIKKLVEENPHLYSRDIQAVASTIFDEISRSLERGDRVELRGFGVFFVKKRLAKKGRNPRTGSVVDVEEKHVPFFKAGKKMREKLNQKG